MAFLIFGKPKYIGGVRIDAFIEEVHNSSASVTSYPVEDGSEISDHVTQNPDGLSITGLVAPRSIYIADLTSFGFTRVFDTYLKIKALEKAGEPISVVTGLKTYTNMIIDQLNITRNKDNGQGLPFTMSLTQIRVVKSRFYSVTQNNTSGTAAVKKQVQSKVEEAKQPPKTFVQEIRDSGVVKAALQ